MGKEEVVKQFTLLKGVGKSKAVLLYDSGFDSLEMLRQASVEDLTKIRGFNEKFAKDIKDQLKKPIAEFEEPAKPKKKAEKRPLLKAKKEEEKPKKKKKAKEEAEEVEIVEEEGYKVKKKPELSKEQREKLLLRQRIKKRRPEFLREEWFRYKRVPRNWRKPDGISSKMRRNYKYRPSMPRVGFRGPRETRDLHPSGFEEVIVHNVNDLEDINPKTQAARIGGSVGTKKRVEIEKRAEDLNVRILNM